MKVAVIVETRIWGGLETHLIGLLAALSGAGHEPILVCVGRDTARLFDDRGLSVGTHCVSRPDLGWFGWRRELAALGAGAAILEKGTLHAGSVGLEIGARVACGRLVTIEQLEPPVLPADTGRLLGGLVPRPGLWRWRRRAEGYLRSVFPTRIVCITEAVRSALCSIYGFPRPKTVVIHNGVDVDRFHYRPECRGPARAALGLPSGGFVFGSMCRLIHDKGLDVAIRAAAILRSRVPDRPFTYIIGGEGTERPRLEALVRALHLADHVKFAGFVSETARYYAALDAFVVPSRIEAQGIVVLEAMASGPEVIATSVGGIPEMVISEELGCLAEPNDAESLSDAMLAALDRDDGERARRRLTARAHVTNHFSAQRQYAALIDLVERLVAAGA